jgi:plastocyanin
MRIFARIVIAAAVASALIAPQAASAAVVVRGTTGTSGFVWKPKRVEIAKGVVVRWKAVAGSHTVVAYGGNWSFSRNLPLGSTTSRTFNRAGTFRYVCSIHGSVNGGTCSGMCGRVVVG